MRWPRTTVLLGLVMLLALSVPDPTNVAGLGVDDLDTPGVTGAHPVRPEHTTTVDVTLPTGGVLLSATVEVTGSPATIGGLDYPEQPAVAIGGTQAWGFAGAGVGALGHQTMFRDGATSLGVDAPAEHELTVGEVLLPVGAIVEEAHAQVTVVPTGEPPRELVELLSFSGVADIDWYGHAVDSAGDVNGDGFDDLIVGAPYSSPLTGQYGRAYLYLGGPAVDAVADVTFVGEGYNNEFGYSVDGAGDVDGDGFDDVIVGAWSNDAGGVDAGRAYIFLGGAAMDNVADVVVTGAAKGDLFGRSVSGAGDVNGDGFDDVIVGACGVDLNGADTGQAQVVLGGAPMDNTPDMTLSGVAFGDYFGRDVSAAGDVDGDGFDDVIVGAIGNDAHGPISGQAYLYRGGSPMDALVDVTFSGTEAFDYFAMALSDAGDVNGDGLGDVIIGAPGATWDNRGRSYVYHGGSPMDSIADVTIDGMQALDEGGSAVSGAGDVNGDGFDDVIVGTPYNNFGGSGAGQAYVYYGGAAMDAAVDVTFTGKQEHDWFGSAVSGAGDVDNDGYADLIVGAPQYGDGTGQAFFYASLPVGPIPFALEVAGVGVLSVDDAPATSTYTVPLADALRQVVPKAARLEPDPWGNQFSVIPLRFSAGTETTLRITDLSVTYRSTVRVDLAPALRPQLDGRSVGTITLPLSVSSASSGGLELGAVQIEVDQPPTAVGAAAVSLAEDSAADHLLDLFEVFADDRTSTDDLAFAMSGGSNTDTVPIRIVDGHFVGADAMTSASNDNWTGTVSVELQATDQSDLSSSVELTITLTPIDDAPVITSDPPTTLWVGQSLTYEVTADDAEGSPLTLQIEAGPAGLRVTDDLGLWWQPTDADVGTHTITLSVSDGALWATQSFPLTVLKDEAPAFTSTPPTIGLVDAPYLYDADATDPEGDAMVYSLASGPQGMDIDPATGLVTWVPRTVGTMGATISVTDGTRFSHQAFTLVISEVAAAETPPTLEPALAVIVQQATNPVVVEQEQQPLQPQPTATPLPARPSLSLIPAQVGMWIPLLAIMASALAALVGLWHQRRRGQQDPSRGCPPTG